MKLQCARTLFHPPPFLGNHPGVNGELEIGCLLCPGAAGVADARWLLVPAAAKPDRVVGPVAIISLAAVRARQKPRSFAEGQMSWQLHLLMSEEAITVAEVAADFQKFPGRSALPDSVSGELTHLLTYATHRP